MDRAYLLLISAALAMNACACHGTIENRVGSRAASGTGTGAGTGTGVGAGTGTQPDAAPLATCGDGQVEPGEACDGSNLSGSSCTTLGFQSGALACAPSCHFDTSGCVGALTLTVKPSRTTCTAPCGIFFDATSTAGLQNSDYVSADFSWDFDFTNVDPNGAHEQTIGFVAAHVFEIPGTYQVSVRVRDMAGHGGSTQIPITVTAMSGPTIYVAATGNDQTALSAVTMAKPLATLAAAITHATAQTSILLRRGDTFKVGTATVFLSSLTGPIVIGAYTDPNSASSAAPIISSTTTYASDASLIEIGGCKDVRLTDLHILSATGGFVGVTVRSSSNHLLLERVEIEGIGIAPSQTGEGLTIDNTSSPVFIVDCHLHNFTGDGIYADRTTSFALIGTTIEKFGGLNHGVRIQGGASPGSAGQANDTYIAENMIAANNVQSAAFDATTVRGDNSNTVYVDNRIQRFISFQPTNDTELEHVTNVLIEGNVLSDNEAPNTGYVSMAITAQHVVVRNNVMINPDIAVDIEGHPLLPANFVDQIYVYNNTDYFYPAAGVSNTYPALFLKQMKTAGMAVLENNILSEGMTSQTSALITSDGKGTVSEDHNLGFAPNVSRTWTGAPSGTGDVVGDPRFASTDPTTSNVFQLTAGSTAIDVGTMTPAFQDRFGVTRPVGAGWDIGASEYQPSSAAASASPDASAVSAAALLPGSAGHTMRRKVDSGPLPR